jgi:hypothetical protein
MNIHSRLQICWVDYGSRVKGKKYEKLEDGQVIGVPQKKSESND